MGGEKPAKKHRWLKETFSSSKRGATTRNIFQVGEGKGGGAPLNSYLNEKSIKKEGNILEPQDILNARKPALLYTGEGMARDRSPVSSINTPEEKNWLGGGLDTAIK